MTDISDQQPFQYEGEQTELSGDIRIIKAIETYMVRGMPMTAGEMCYRIDECEPGLLDLSIEGREDSLNKMKYIIELLMDQQIMRRHSYDRYVLPRK